MANKVRALPRSVFLVESERLFREGLKKLLLNAGISELAEAETIEEALELADRNHPPSVAMITLGNGTDGGSLQTIQRFREEFPDTKIMVLIRQPTSENVRLAMEVGAHVCASKDISMRTLLLYLEMLAIGERVLSIDLVRVMLEGRDVRRAEGTRGIPGFSKREVDILECLAQGMRNREIGSRLGIRESTVKFHLSSVLRKIGASNRTQAVLWARDHVANPVSYLS
jgi:two-component system nitrate/nitrite response regulator NarL